MRHLGACRRGSLMRSIEVCDAERDLCAAGSTPILRLVEGEVHLNLAPSPSATVPADCVAQVRDNAPEVTRRGNRPPCVRSKRAFV